MGKIDALIYIQMTRFRPIKIRICDKFIMADNPQKISKSRLKIADTDLYSIHNNALNSSSSKMQYSIPKSPRWVDSPDHKLMSNSKFYDLPSISSNRSTSFGYGNKVDISKQNVKTPSPGAYLIQSEFKRNLNKKRGYSMSLGRDNIKSVSTFNEKPFIVPGPQQYSVKHIESKSKVLIASRLADHSDKWVLSVPGPGAYKTLDLLDKNMKSSLAKYSSVAYGKFDRSFRKSEEEKQERFLNVPGPGKYPVEQSFETIKQFHLDKGRRFSHSQRKGIVDKSITPGPGSYLRFSEFLH